MRSKILLTTLVFVMCYLSRLHAQSDWQGTWTNYDINNHTQVFQVKIDNDKFSGLWYTNDDWHFYKVVFKGELSKKGTRVTGTYRYTDNSEHGIFDLKIDEFSKKAPQYAAGCRLFFEGHLGTDKYNMRSWNASKRSDDTSSKPLLDFVDTFKMERPKKYTAEEMIAQVRAADFLREYRSKPADAGVPAIKTCQLNSYCADGNFTVKGVNKYIIADFYFYKEGSESACAIYLSVADKIIGGRLKRSTTDAMGNEEREYELGGQIGNAVVTKMTIKNGYMIIYFSEYSIGKKLNCHLEKF